MAIIKLPEMNPCTIKAAAACLNGSDNSIHRLIDAGRLLAIDISGNAYDPDSGNKAWRVIVYKDNQGEYPTDGNFNLSLEEYVSAFCNANV